MHISSLAIHGFKSFGKKVTLKFGRGVTAVVGPNGCGKTNIVDALRWVIGEQRQSVMRAGRMEEIIFNGSRHHKPSSVCEVSLTIHNDKAKLPSEYTDVEITRRLYRDGESEYLINREPCRLKDITDLFMDTGMGSDAYSVIELKMVEGILSEVGEDRRRMFEEAAGVNKYKKQRASAHRKLDATRQDLERINDIAGEVESKVRGLALQLKRFERHSKLSAQLLDRELALARLEVQELAVQMTPLEVRIKAARSGRDSDADDIVAEEKLLVEQRHRLTAQETELQAVRTALTAANESLNEHRRQVLVWNEQVSGGEANLERIGREKTREEAAIAGRREAVERLAKELAGLAPDMEARRKLLAGKQADEGSFLEALRVAEASLEEAREKKFRQRQETADLTSHRNRLAELLAEKQAALAELQADLSRAGETSAAREQEKEVLANELEQLALTLAALDEQAGERQRKRKKLDQEITGAREKFHYHQTQAQLLQSKLELLQRLSSAHQGYPAGARSVLDNADGYPGLIGAVAELLEVDPAQALAVETALGSLATALVVETAGQAQALLDRAREQELGRLAVIPLDAVAADQGISAPAPPAGARPLLEVVTVEDRLLPLYRHLLGGFYLADADKMPAGLGLSPGAEVITPEGHRYGPVPVWVHGGGAGSGTASESGAAVVGLKMELQQVGAAAHTARQERDRAQAELDRLLSALEAVTTQTAGLEQETADARQRQAQLGDSLVQVELELQRHAAGSAAQGELLPALLDEISQLEPALAEQNQVLQAASPLEKRLDGAMAKAQEDHAKARRSWEAWREDLLEQRVALINLENDREKLAERKLTLEDTIGAGGERLLTLDEEAALTGARRDDLGQRVTEAAGQEQVLVKAADEVQEAVRAQEGVVREARDAISGREAALRSRQHIRETALDDLQAVELELEQLRQKEELIRARIREVYGQKVGQSEPEDATLDPAEMDQEVQQIRRSLERIGPVNMAVADEHAEELERFSFLTEQRDDLVTAEASLLETIGKVDHQAREQFQDTYDKIRHHFKQTFAMFFDGGEGDLRLVGDPDPLESDIEIIAVPPGKKSRSLRSLSAGEKALTAIALLFAIYMVKPSPYCILDEVDAPLDDTNIGKFNKVLSQFAAETQFIIVTHNKLSMEKADYLYGVTMQEEGLSTLVSVDLQAYAA